MPKKNETRKKKNFSPLIYLLWAVICLLVSSPFSHTVSSSSIEYYCRNKSEKNNKCVPAPCSFRWYHGNHLKKKKNQHKTSKYRLLVECGKITCDNFDLAWRYYRRFFGVPNNLEKCQENYYIWCQFAPKTIIISHWKFCYNDNNSNKFYSFLVVAMASDEKKIKNCNNYSMHRLTSTCI